MYGIYSKASGRFMFGIMEVSKRQARNKLFQKVGKNISMFEIKLMKG